MKLQNQATRDPPKRLLALPHFEANGSAWPIGESPFRARGLLFQGAIDYYDVAIPGGRAALLQSLEPRLRAFSEQMFIPSAKFDALPVVPLSAAAAKLLGRPHLDLVRDNARWLAERDLRGVLKLLLGVLSAATVAQRLPRAALRYFDFGEGEAAMSAPNVCHGRQHAIPAFLAEWFAAAVEGFVPVVLQKAGARMPRVRTLGTPATVTASTQLISLEFEFGWLGGAC